MKELYKFNKSNNADYLSFFHYHYVNYIMQIWEVFGEVIKFLYSIQKHHLTQQIIKLP
jgi:hypothetical protein